MSAGCSEGSYVALNGLEFEKMCNMDSDAPELRSLTTQTFEECLMECSEHNDKTCREAVFDVSSKACSLKGQGSSTSSSISLRLPSETKATGFANQEQLLPLDSACPVPNNTAYKTKNGMEFEVLCNQLYAGDDMRFTGLETEGMHTDTFEECMELCSKNQALCMGVMWNSDQQNGYANCYPKTSNDKSKMEPNPIYLAHSAVVPNLTVDETCNDDATTTSGDSTFISKCGQAIDGANLSATHANTLDECIAACAEYTPPSDGPSCSAVMYDPRNTKGFENCLLKESADGMAVSTDYDVAALSGSVPSSSAAAAASESATAETVPGDSMNIPAIAGGAAGGVVAVVLVAGALVWWRRKKRRQARAATPVAAVEKDNDAESMWRALEIERTGGAATPQQMELIAETRRMELDSNFKMVPVEMADSSIIPELSGDKKGPKFKI